MTSYLPKFDEGTASPQSAACVREACLPSRRSDDPRADDRGADDRGANDRHWDDRGADGHRSGDRPAGSASSHSVESPSNPMRTLELLARQIRDMETAGRPDQERIGSGCRAMDRHLPGNGYARGSMVEMVRNGNGTGVSTLAMLIARQAMTDGKYLVVVDPQRQFYPPAMRSLGIPLERVIALQPTNYADSVWGLDQVLRCTAVGAVVVEAGNWDDRVSRRLQLACEQGGGLGIVTRDIRSLRGQPSWADVQWRVGCLPQSTSSRLDSDARLFRLELTRCNGGRTGARITVGIDSRGQWIDVSTHQGAGHEHASALHLAAQLAQPTRQRREAAS